MTVEIAKEIREELKNLGINNRQVSVTLRHGLCESMVWVKIKDESIDVKTVRNIAIKNERIRRCDITGKILSDGNAYVSIG